MSQSILERQWTDDIKEQIIIALSANNFALVEALARLGNKVQIELANGHGWVCCNRVFKTREAWRTHRKQIHDKPLLKSIGRTCATCGKRFQNKSGLAAHLRRDRNPHKEAKQRQ